MIFIRRFRLIPALLVLAGSSVALHAAEVAVLVSKDIAMYRSAVKAIQDAVPAESVSVHVLPSDNSADVAQVLDDVKQGRPKVIMSVGSKAAMEALRVLPKTG
ncbi:MAG: hypothetical protein HY548_04245, partial [Elusimicrobia bacterium]|nr:hypothetical protein [Elusimicrobiota bacterium]